MYLSSLEGNEMYVYIYDESSKAAVTKYREKFIHNYGDQSMHAYLKTLNLKIISITMAELQLLIKTKNCSLKLYTAYDH